MMVFVIENFDNTTIVGTLAAEIAESTSSPNVFDSAVTPFSSDDIVHVVLECLQYCTCGS